MTHGEIETAVDELPRQVPREVRVPGHFGKLALAPAFVRDFVPIRDGDRECRDEVEEERGEVIVREENDDVGLLAFEPRAHRLVALEQRFPVGRFFVATIHRRAYRWRMRRAEAGDD